MHRSNYHFFTKRATVPQLKTLLSLLWFKNRLIVWLYVQFNREAEPRSLQLQYCFWPFLG